MYNCGIVNKYIFFSVSMCKQHIFPILDKFKINIRYDFLVIQGSKGSGKSESICVYNIKLVVKTWKKLYLT